MNSFRILILVLFLTPVMRVSAQSIPIEQIDSTWSETNNPEPIRKILSNYESYIVYALYSSWTKDTEYHLLGFRQGKWEARRIFVDYEGDWYPEQKDYTVRTKKVRISQAKAKEVFTYLDSLDFWELSPDSLGEKGDLYVTDGSTDVFFIRSGKESFAVFVYMADYYQENVPNSERLVFILCRDRFRAAFR